jgi:hypothetical protein
MYKGNKFKKQYKGKKLLLFKECRVNNNYRQQPSTLKINNRLHNKPLLPKVSKVVVDKLKVFTLNKLSHKLLIKLLNKRFIKKMKTLHNQVNKQINSMLLQLLNLKLRFKMNQSGILRLVRMKEFFSIPNEIK